MRAELIGCGCDTDVVGESQCLVTIFYAQASFSLL
jgi:hypothetical protein